MKKPGGQFSLSHLDTLTSANEPVFPESPRKRKPLGLTTGNMVQQHAPPKTPARPQPAKEAAPKPTSAAVGAPEASTPKKAAAALPIDDDWFDDGVPSQSNSQSLSQDGLELLEQFNSLSINAPWAKDDKNQSPAPAEDDSVVEIPKPASFPQRNLLTSNTGNARKHDPFTSGMYGSQKKPGFGAGPGARPMSSAQQKALKSVFHHRSSRPERHLDPVYPVLSPMKAAQAAIKTIPASPTKMYSSADLFGKTEKKQPLASFADTEFYTDPKKAASDLKALLEGGMDEDDEDEKKEDEEETNDGTLEGLNVKLLPHQVEGVEWMKGRELGPVKRGKVPRGGILADDMGLGKTLQSISLILSNQLPDKDDKTFKKIYTGHTKGTLVVAPLALIRQWEAEIKEKVSKSRRLKVYVHHGPNRIKSHKELALYDVVVTTYQTLVSEHGNSNDEKGLKSGCFGVHWWRVILDEAHTVKNRNAKATKACCALSTVFRWCLTGTPMQNNLDELQSLIHFLRIQPYNDLGEWREHIDKPMKNGKGHLAMSRLHSLLRCFMKRRTKDILKVDGALNPGGKPSKPGEGSSTGFKVTERRVVAIASEFSAPERRFYDRLQARADRSLEKMLKGRKVNYANALVLLLRLRQVCDHPKLVEGKLEKDRDALSTDSGASQRVNGSAVTQGAIDDLADLLAGTSIRSKDCGVCGCELNSAEMATGLDRCQDCHEDLQYFKKQGKGAVEVEAGKKHRAGRKDKKRRKEKKEKSVEKETSATAVKRSRRPAARRVVMDSDDEEEEGSWLVPEDQRSALKLGKAGGEEDENAEGGGESIGSDDSLHESEAEEDGSQLDSFIVKDDTLPQRDERPTDDESDSDDDADEAFPSVQELCSQPLEADASAASLQDDDDTESEESESNSDSQSDSDSDDEDDDSDVVTVEDDDNGVPHFHVREGRYGTPVVASAKIRELIKILRKEAEEHKFIVFSQFTSMLDVVEPFLDDEGFNFTRYDGSMKNDEREMSLHKLRNDKKTRILLCSLKCGSLGLNLTAATRVVILEPFWNPFIEEQAIDRVHRLTQKIDVIVYKLTVAGTVEERILQLQDKKRLLAEQAIEGGMKKGGFKLGLVEMLELFKHDGSKDFAGEYESGGAGERRGGVLESSRGGKPGGVRREESAVYGRRW